MLEFGGKKTMNLGYYISQIFRFFLNLGIFFEKSLEFWGKKIFGILRKNLWNFVENKTWLCPKRC